MQPYGSVLKWSAKYFGGIFWVLRLTLKREISYILLSLFALGYPFLTDQWGQTSVMVHVCCWKPLENHHQDLRGQRQDFLVGWGDISWVSRFSPGSVGRLPLVNERVLWFHGMTMCMYNFNKELKQPCYSVYAINGQVIKTQCDLKWD